MKFIGNIDDDGKLRIYHADRFKALKDSLKGKQIELTLSKRTKQVSNPQRGYLHGCMIPELINGFYNIGETFDKKQMYEWWKYQFCYKEVVIESTGEIMKVPYDLSDNGDATTFIMKEAIEKCQRWAAENLDHYIPDPNEQIKADFNEESEQ